MAHAADFSPLRRLFLVAFGVLFCFLTAGVIFGFSALKDVLIASGVYAHLCDGEAVQTATKGCKAQIVRLDLIFTVATSVTNMSALLIGYLLDRSGPRVTAIVGSLLFLVGNILFAFSDNTVDMFIPAYILLAVGGPCVFLSTLHLGAAFPNNSGLVIALLTGSFDASSVVYKLYKTAYESVDGGISIKHFFGFYCIVPAGAFVYAVLMMPKTSFQIPVNNAAVADKVDDADEDEDDDLTAGKTTVDGTVSGATGRIPLADQPFMQQIVSEVFWLLVVFMCLFMLRLNFYMATIRKQLELLDPDVDPAVVDEAASMFEILLPLGGVVAIPPTAWLLDCFTIDVSYAVLAVMGAAFGVLSLVPNVPLQYAAIAIFVLFRPLLYTAANDFCAQTFGFKTFGKVYGLMTLLCGVFNFLQYALTELALNVFEDYAVVNWSLTIMTSTFGSLLPIYLWWTHTGPRRKPSHKSYHKISSNSDADDEEKRSLLYENDDDSRVAIDTEPLVENTPEPDEPVKPVKRSLFKRKITSTPQPEQPECNPDDLMAAAELTLHQQ